MKYIFLVSAFLLIESFLLGQNLVPNPSFEEYTPYQGEWCAGITAFDTIVDHWESFSVTPDYFNSCVNDEDPNSGVPSNAWGWQYPASGNAYASLITYVHYSPEGREYIACQLTGALEIGLEYYVMFYISHYDGGVSISRRCATNHFGAKFFVDRQYGSGDDGDYPRYWPQNESDVEYNEMLSDSAGWTLVEGLFTADSAYTWLALGNFFDDVNTDTMQFGDKGECTAMYYIDNVCIAKEAGDCDYMLGLEYSPLEIKTVKLFPNPSENNTTLASNNKLIKKYIVYDTVGKAIQEENNISALRTNINTSWWPSGIYFIHVQFYNSSVTTLKYIKR